MSSPSHCPCCLPALMVHWNLLLAPRRTWGREEPPQRCPLRCPTDLCLPHPHPLQPLPPSKCSCPSTGVLIISGVLAGQVLSWGSWPGSSPACYPGVRAQGGEGCPSILVFAALFLPRASFLGYILGDGRAGQRQGCSWLAAPLQLCLSRLFVRAADLALVHVAECVGAAPGRPTPCLLQALDPL